MIRRARALVIFIAALAFRCATATSGRYQKIQVSSDPSGAVAAVLCKPGWKSEGITPAVLTVPRKSPSCVVLVSSEGLSPVEVPLTQLERDSAMDRIFESIEEGGVCASGDSGAVGCLMMAVLLSPVIFGSAYVSDRIDAGTGAIFDHHPDVIHVRLTPPP